MSDQNQEEVLDLEAPDEEIALDFEKVRPKSGHKIDKTRRKELIAKRFVFNEYTTKDESFLREGSNTFLSPPKLR